MPHAFSTRRKPIRTPLFAITAMLVVGILPFACGSVRGTGKPLLQKEREESMSSAAASVPAPTATSSSVQNSPTAKSVP
ncbi:MAG: hypothetical protein ACKO3W_11555 [bacterium]